MSDEIANLPGWVRRRDGSQVPFDADRICQSLYAAAESLGSASAFLIRELTDVVLHFLSQDPFLGTPTTAQLAEEVEKIVREIGQPALARRYAEQRQTAGASPPPVTIDCTQVPEQFLSACFRAYSRSTLYSPDVIAAVDEGLLRLDGWTAPASLTSLVLDTPRLADLPWWALLDDWRLSGGVDWIVESPEWLCTIHPHPALTTHLCDRLLALPMLADRAVELHLNIAGPPAWSLAHQASPLFAAVEDDFVSRERAVFLDNFLERWRTLQAPRVPALAWHLTGHSFQSDSERQQLQFLLRQALQGKAVRFVFDRPGTAVALAEGLDRRSPGMLLEIGLDLSRLAERPEIAGDGANLLKKLPSLARIAVSAAGQRRRFLRGLPEASPLRRGFLIERAPAAVAPIGLDRVVRAVTGASLVKSPLALDFALQILQVLNRTFEQAGRALNLDLRLDGDLGGAPQVGFSPRHHLEASGRLHAAAGAGTATLLLADELDTNIDDLTELLRWTWEATGVVRLRLQRADRLLHQGELPI